MIVQSSRSYSSTQAGSKSKRFGGYLITPKLYFSVPINSVSPCMSQVDDGFEPLPAAIRPPQPFGALQVPGSALRMAPGSGWKCLSLWTLTHHLRGHLLLVFRNSQKAQERLTISEQTETNMTTSFKNKSRLFAINLTWIRWETDVAGFTWSGK